MSEFRIDQITNRDGSAGPQICGVSTFSGTSGMQLPVGPTEYRGGRGRAIFGSRATPGAYPGIDAVEIATKGNAIDFGVDIICRQENYGTCASSTRGLFAGGYNTVTSADINTISYLTISSGGGVSDFGDLSGSIYPDYSDGGFYGLAGTNDSTRGLFGGGQGPSNAIHYVTIATTGDASDFGDLKTGRAYALGGIGNGTRGIIGGGSPLTILTYGLDYVNIQTKGNAQDFGNMTAQRQAGTGMSNTTRGITGGGQNPNNLNTIDYFTIATLGDAIDFGDITYSSTNGVDYLGSAASATRGLFAGGQTPAKKDNIEYITISTTGDSVDFGDLQSIGRFSMGLSDVNGGLG